MRRMRPAKNNLSNCSSNCEEAVHFHLAAVDMLMFQCFYGYLITELTSPYLRILRLLHCRLDGREMILNDTMAPSP